MLVHQPKRCMKHDLIADVVKSRFFLKIVWANFLLTIRVVKGTKSNIFTCKLCA